MILLILVLNMGGADVVLLPEFVYEPQPQPQVQVLPGQLSPQEQITVFDVEVPQVHFFVVSIFFDLNFKNLMTQN